MQDPHPLTAGLLELDTLKTWSLIVTVFGDLEGDELTGTQLRKLLGHIGIKPEAIRVALHRLKSDGWIAAHKRGREAVYSFTAKARQETDLVRGDVYGATSKYPDGWCFVLHEEVETPQRAIVLNRNLALLPHKPGSAQDGAVVLSPQSGALPEWLEAEMVSGTLRNIAAALAGLLERETHPVRAIDTMAQRLLVLHHWRRIALRDGSWAHAHFLPEGPVARCHRHVTGYLARTAPLSQAEIGKLA